MNDSTRLLLDGFDINDPDKRRSITKRRLLGKKALSDAFGALLDRNREQIQEILIREFGRYIQSPEISLPATAISTLSDGLFRAFANQMQFRGGLGKKRSLTFSSSPGSRMRLMAAALWFDTGDDGRVSDKEKDFISILYDREYSTEELARGVDYLHFCARSIEQMLS